MELNRMKGEVSEELRLSFEGWTMTTRLRQHASADCFYRPDGRRTRILAALPQQQAVQAQGLKRSAMAGTSSPLSFLDLPLELVVRIVAALPSAADVARIECASLTPEASAQLPSALQPNAAVTAPSAMHAQHEAAHLECACLTPEAGAQRCHVACPWRQRKRGAFVAQQQAHCTIGSVACHARHVLVCRRLSHPYLLLSGALHEHM